MVKPFTLSYLNCRGEGGGEYQGKDPGKDIFSIFVVRGNSREGWENVTKNVGN